MKALGIFIIIVGVIGGAIGAILLGVYGIWDILKHFNTMTFGEFLWDMVLIFGREIIALIVIGLLYLLGIFLIEKG